MAYVDDGGLKPCEVGSLQKIASIDSGSAVALILSLGLVCIALAFCCFLRRGGSVVVWLCV